MQSTQTFLLFVENPLAINKQKHTIIGPHSSRRKPPKVEGVWASYEVVIHGELIHSLKESGTHLKSPPKTLDQQGQSIRILSVPMAVGDRWNEIQTRNPAVAELLKIMLSSYNRTGISAA